MNADVEFHIRNNYTWTKLPTNIKQLVGNSHKEYDKHVINFSIANQLRFKGNLIRHVMKDEKRYYDELLKYSQLHLMLYPYHLSDVVVKGLRVTPFQYYIAMMQEIMKQEKSYDSLPNFTAADCLRLLGIGRNQYIELMNQCRSSKRFFRRKGLRELLPLMPIDDVSIDPWWHLQPGYITDDDMKMVTPTEKDLIDSLIDEGAKPAGNYKYQDVHGLYLKGLVYIDVSIEDEDFVIVPPLEGFVMNRVQGDYFETLLYKIFVSIDENTSINELSNVLQIDLNLVKNAVSMYCRLGFARKKNTEELSEYHPSWATVTKTPKKSDNCNLLMTDFNQSLELSESDSSIDTSSMNEKKACAILSGVTSHRRIGFLFDSTLTAFLMMGNLSPGLKSHAVTMFEVGKLSDETLDSFVNELDKVGANIAEGEAQRYFEHAFTLRSTISILRYNANMSSVCDHHQHSAHGLALDLIRCESLQSLDSDTCTRLLKKNYEFLVSMAPLTHEIRPISSCSPPHIGPAIPEVNSVWFKLFVYKITECGPPSLLLVKGCKLKRLPKIFHKYERLLVTTWGHDPGIVPTSNALLTINDALLDSAVLIQAHSNKSGLFMENENVYIPFPFDNENEKKSGLAEHPAVLSLSNQVDLHHSCGYITMVYNPDCDPSTAIDHHRYSSNSSSICNVSCDQPTNGFKNKQSAQIMASELKTLQGDVDSDSDTNHSVDTNVDYGSFDQWTILNCSFGIPLFDGPLNQAVCNKIVQNGLCSQKSLKNLTQSSRKLCLSLLKFVAENQLASISLDTKASNETSIFDISLPTKNLIFNGTQLSEWNGW